jgi:large subunit ribosomal protein L9
MKIILLQELRGKGGEGDVIEVATGYAVNYLFPQKIAIEASQGNLKQLELRRHNIAKREELRLDSADKMLAALEGKLVRIPSKVGDEGQLFGSVTTAQIAEALLELHGIEVDRKNIETFQAIKSVGEHEVEVSIYRNIRALINVLVVDESAPLEDEDELSDEATEGDEAAEGDGEAAATDGEAEDGAADDSADQASATSDVTEATAASEAEATAAEAEAEAAAEIEADSAEAEADSTVAEAAADVAEA